MKTKWLLIFISILWSNLFAQDIVGTWQGTLELPTIKLPIVFHFTEEENQLKATMDSPMQGATGIPVDEVINEKGVLELKVKASGLVYTAKIDGDKLIGTFKQAGMEFPLVLAKKNNNEVELRPQTPKPPYDYITKEVEVFNKKQEVKLAGTLSLPREGNDFPIVVMITGSGTQNRDEEIFGHKPFLVIANYLAKYGIGSLRMDDRGIGGSDEGKPNPTTADFATDIASAVEYLTTEDYTNIGLLGHSEGGMIAPIVAVDDVRVKFLVLLAAPGIPCSELLILQNDAIARGYGMPDSLLEHNKKINRLMYDFIDSYEGDNIKADMRAFMKKENLPIDEKQLKVLTSPWFQYFIRFNPNDYLQKIKIPVLALNGSLDLQVLADENLHGIEKSLQATGNKKFETKKFDGLNHLFQNAKTGLPVEYGQIEETISLEVLETISNWIKQL
ncbi:hypothetical protein C7377_0172 [Balneicella halophila]|uniref:Serine aminopeptidase S33 domain-containing protein n=1 Tax=Balneicella halophila TaxID=1537566 RepID=A0A7L4UR09_BALHA|nr:alpha/beta hydrolase [Balneicella halophila]PVX51881.1 hypothetical protein C7377_0172 [Balneicella halophila]